MSVKTVVNKLSRMVGGKEIFSPIPVAAPVNWKKPKSVQEMMVKYMRDASEYAARSGHETFEEAEDFDIGEEDDFESPWELDFDPITGKEMYRGQREELDKARSEFDSYVKSKRKKPNGKFEEEQPVSRKKKSVETDEE